MTDDRPAPATTPRRRGPARRQEILTAARRILEEDGAAALTMRRLGDAVGMRAPSLYKHFPDKAAVEAALIDEAFQEFAAVATPALSTAARPLVALANAYRAHALTHPHIYRLLTAGALPRERLQPDSEELGAAPLLAALPDPDRARAFWAFLHGMTILELDDRFPPGADLEGAWAAGIAAFATDPANRGGDTRE